MPTPCGLLLLVACVLFVVSDEGVSGQRNAAMARDPMQGIVRQKCANRINSIVRPVSIYRKRLRDLRTEMQIRASVQGSELDAYIVTSFDEHQSEFVAPEDKRRQFLTGFNGTTGDAVVTITKAALWTDERFLQEADTELDCEWLLFKMGDTPSIAQWLANNLHPDSKVGADPHYVPHYLWQEWEDELSLEYIRLMKINRNLIDGIWTDKPKGHNDVIRTHPLAFAGDKWETKVEKLRQNLSLLKCDAMVVTSLTEVAYLLNLRGNDIPYVPVFKAYAIVTAREVLLYLNQSRVNLGVSLHLKADPCHHETCVQLRNYSDIWKDLRTYSQQWKRVLIPSFCVYDMGASEAIFSAVPKAITFPRVSPIIHMRAQKNQVERQGMFNAHVRDGAAMCDVLSYLEEKFIMLGDHYTEIKLSREIDLTRRSQKLSHDISFETVVAFAEHGALEYYVPNNLTDSEITDASTIVIDSGGQYQDGTTDVARTVHLGEPTAEQKKAYTLVLAAMIKLSMLVFPENIRLAEVDILPRGIMWGDLSDYPHGTGHGIGSYLSVKESPINIAYTAKHKYTFKEGNFFSNEPGFYKPNDFGIKLKNVLEVYDTGKVHPSGKKFLAFRDVTLVPFEPKLIDRALLSTQEKRWLNEYNAKIREFVGEELKKQTKMQAFYWMMNKTKHVIEYLPEKEYRSANDGVSGTRVSLAGLISSTLIVLILATNWATVNLN